MSAHVGFWSRLIRLTDTFRSGGFPRTPPILQRSRNMAAKPKKPGDGGRARHGKGIPEW